MPFPDEHDRAIIRSAEQVDNLATDLYNWLSEFNPARRSVDLLPISESDEFEVLQLRRMARSLYTSAKVPVAAAVYGPSQTGKSLFVGQVLLPHSEDFCPIGADETYGEPAYFKHLSFDDDLNPQCGSNEATALVCRFTTKDRIGIGVSQEYPVMVRALTRVEWLRVLARGFHVECKASGRTNTQSELEEIFEDIHRRYHGDEIDRKWRIDILDTYSYMRAVDHRGFVAKESVVNGMLSRYALSEEGYIECVSTLFWDSWESLTGLFRRINTFLEKINLGDWDPCIFVQWAGVRFLLDSQRQKVHLRKQSRVWKRVAWEDMYLVPKDKYFVMEHRPDTGMSTEDLETIQAGMLEMSIPTLPHRLNDDWRQVIEQMDFIDIPGMRAGRQGVEQGKRTDADSEEEQMSIVKRGKVAYLFERYVEELQIQTLLLLNRGGNLEVTSQMKHHIDMWGRARYGDKIWPNKVHDSIPALFVAMTGIDEEFRNREEYADKSLYESRLGQIVDSLGPVMNDFGGRGKAFTNTYPIRYPGTWDTNEEQRQENDPERWVRAGQAFVESPLVQEYVANPEQRWKAAMTDGDGGLSLVSVGIRQCTTAEDKQAQLTKRITEIKNRLLQVSRDWVVDPDANVDREKRLRAARKVVEWLQSSEELIYYRVQALQEALSLAEGDELMLADCIDTQSRRRGDPLPRQLENFLHEWATTAVPKRWEEFTSSHKEGEPWLDPNDLGAFARYLRDYLKKKEVFDQMLGQLNPVVNLKTRDEAARRRARRKYVQVILNDYVMNPGPGMTKLEDPDAKQKEEEQEAVAGVYRHESDEEKAQREEEERQKWLNYGLMGGFVERWSTRMPLALALGAGEHIKLPPGNAELIDMLSPFEKVT